MNLLVIASVCCLVGPALSNYWDTNDGFRRTNKGVEAVYNNAARQVGVNRLAEKVGASSGTARNYGVPGTGNYFPGNRYGYGYDDSYGYDNRFGYNDRSYGYGRSGKYGRDNRFGYGEKFAGNYGAY